MKVATFQNYKKKEWFSHKTRTLLHSVSIQKLMTKMKASIMSISFPGFY